MPKRTRKHDKPQTLDLDFDEALGRLVQARPAEDQRQDDQRVRLIMDDDTGDRLVFYSTAQGLRVEAHYDGSEIRMTQAQMSRLFDRDQSVISRHLKRIEQMDGLPPETLYAESAYEVGGQKHHRRLYTVDAINYVGFRVNSPQGILFRRWANEVLKKIIAKGFYIDEERLKNPDDDGVLAEFKETARRIRGAIQNSYREVRSLCTLCSDYDGSSETARSFFMDMENKLLWAAAQRTAPQLVMERCDVNKDDLGLTYYAGKRGPTKKDVVIGNNYLAEGEARTKNRITVMWLDYVEEQLEQDRMPTMAAVHEKLIGFIKFNQWPLLTTRGRHSRDDADRHALEQLEIYRTQQIE